MSEMNPGGMGQGLEGAQCVLHPDQSAERTCTRCGNFMCSTCSEGGSQQLCPTCLQRLGLEQSFPLHRDNWSFSALWDYCFAIFQREWLMLSVAVLIFFGLAFVVQLITGLLPLAVVALKNQAATIIVQVATFFIQQVAQGALGLGLMRVMLDVLQGGKLDVGRLFSQLHKIGTFLIATLLITAVVLIPMALIGGIGYYAIITEAIPKSAWPMALILVPVLLIPLIYFGLPLALLNAEIAYSDGVTAMQALRNCYAYARGERASIFGVSLVAGLVGFAGLLACCIGVLPAMGLAYLLLGGLYLALRTSPPGEG